MLIQRNTSGFTLVEMAMVLMIVGLLLGGLLVPLSAQMDQVKTNETRRMQESIREALVGYALIYGYLPCPAQATLETGLANAGEEATTGNTCACKTASGSDKTVADTSVSKVACTDTTVTGVLPWVTLGIDETDAWGRRYTYRVTTHFADRIPNPYVWGCGSPEPTTASFTLCSQGVPDVLVAAGGANVATDVPAVVISHGKNGDGAYTQQGTQQTPGSDNDELENSDNDNSFVSHDFVQNGFDDLVVWVPNSILLNRMVTAGKLP